MHRAVTWSLRCCRLRCKHRRRRIVSLQRGFPCCPVVLIGGDIHVSRHLRYPLKERLGYDLQQWIVSPLHERIIPELNVPHPALLWGEPIPNVFLQVIADSTKSPATLTANWITRAGKQVHSVHLTANDLAAG